MENTLGLLGSAGGGVLSSRGSRSTAGSMSTVSREDLVLSSEVSSSHPDESELELGLGLSLGGGAAAARSSKAASWSQYARILTAKDFPSLVSKSASSSSSSSSSVTKANPASAGTKRTADSVSPPRNSSGQVVGWPPIRAYRMNSLVNQAKSPIAEEFSSKVDESLRKSSRVDKTNDGVDKNNGEAKEKKLLKTSLFVKVNLDGVPIGRKVDLSVHSNYENLAQTLDDMFFCTRRSGIEENKVILGAAKPSRLLDGSSEFVLTYEDKEGDWMLVGDVPWGMFLSSVKRLRIMRTSEANGLAPRSLEHNGRQTTKSV